MYIKKDEESIQKPAHNDSFGELFVHQTIEMIEFVLGSISNTASYLRLWALSLAHEQLASVILNLLMGNTVASGDSVAGTVFVVILLFPVVLMITFCVVMFMDCMECFLHALRLHWVEFQNKFFKGGGILFMPFNNEF